MDRHGEAIYDTSPGLAPWEGYGPSTRRGDRFFVFLLMRPYDTVSLRGLPVRRVRAVRALGTGQELDFTVSATAEQELIGGKGVIGEVLVSVPESVVDPLATVIELAIEEG